MSPRQHFTTLSACCADTALRRTSATAVVWHCRRMSPLGLTAYVGLLMSTLLGKGEAFVASGGGLGLSAVTAQRQQQVRQGCRRGRTADGLFMNKGFGVAKKPAVKKKKDSTQWGGFKFTGNIRPGSQSPTRTVPPEITRPDYALDGIPKMKVPDLPWNIEVKNLEDIAGMKVAGRIAREVLDEAGAAVKAGATTDDVDRVCHEAMIKRGAYPSTLNYHNYPKSCCTSIDEIVCHGIPDDTVLEEGMMVNLDVTVFYDGYHGDCSEMFCVGEVDQAGKDLIQVTYDAWQEAIAFCKPGLHYKGIGGVIQSYVEKRGYTTVKNFCGHGIGKMFHTNPNILHYRNHEPNGVMKAGHTFTIEPMICEGTPKNVVWPDNWTAATADGKRTAQFEHTLLMTEDGVVPLTGKLETSPKQFWEK